MDIYEFVKNIGNGMYGQVYLANHKLEQKLYAIKRINFKDINTKDRENIENEVKLLKELKHPNIVSYKDSFCDRETFFNIVMVHCDGGDFYNKIKSSKGKYYAEQEIIDWIVQLGLALLYIHDKKILHRDLKTQNLFLKDGKIRIGDFGIAKMFNHTRDLANSMVGTPLYMSPEQYNSKKYGFKSDIWAFGCCLYEMSNLKHAFEGLTWNAVALKVLKGNHAPVNSIYSKELRTLIDLMLSVNPKNRPTISFILERPFIKKRVASYIFDFIQSYTIDPISDKEDIHIEILKEQAEKLGIFNQLLLKEINPYDENSEKAIKQMNDSKDQNFISYMSYLNKKQEEKKKIEEKIIELEKQKKQIYANIRGRDVKKNSEKESSSEKKFYYENLKLISSSVERKKAIGKIDRENIKRMPKQIISESDEFIKIKSNIGINNKDASFCNLKRPDSSKKSPRLPSSDKQDYDDLDESCGNAMNIQSKSKFHEKAMKTKLNYNENAKDQEKTKRPASGYHNNNQNNYYSKKEVNFNNNNRKKTNSNSKSKNRPLVGNSVSNQQFQNSSQGNLVVNNNTQSNLIALNNSRESYHQISMIKKDDSFDENILETIREEAEGGKLNEDKTKIVKLTNEIVRMREYLGQMQNKIQVIEKKMGDKNKLKNETEIENNDSYLNTNEGYLGINTNYGSNNYYQHNSNEIDEVNTEISDIQDENDDEEKQIQEKEKIEDDGTNKVNERIKIMKQKCQSALGYKLYMKAYEYLKNNRTNDPISIREHLINLFGKNNIGFWLLLDHILILEDVING